MGSLMCQQQSQVNGFALSQPEQTLEVHDGCRPEPLQVPFGLSHVSGVAQAVKDQLGDDALDMAAQPKEISEVGGLLTLSLHLQVDFMWRGLQ